MRHPETYLVTKSHVSPSPGLTDKCCYCKSKIGMEHEPECVMRKRTVVLRYSFEVAVVVPEAWSVERILSHRNDSSWCADNALDELDRASPCLCEHFTCEYVREASEGDDDHFALWGSPTDEEADCARVDE